MQDKFDFSAASSQGDREKRLLSYGPCQFPTLGLIVQREWCVASSRMHSLHACAAARCPFAEHALQRCAQIGCAGQQQLVCFPCIGNCWHMSFESSSSLREIQSHVAERFWYIHMSYQAPGASGGGRCSFEWRRGRLFDHVVATVLYEVCCEDPTATILRVRSSAVMPLLLTVCCSTVRVQVLHARDRKHSTYFSEQLSALSVTCASFNAAWSERRCGPLPDDSYLVVGCPVIISRCHVIMLARCCASNLIGR